MKIEDIRKLNYVATRKTTKQCNNSIEFIEKILKESVHPVLESILGERLGALYVAKERLTIKQKGTRT